MSAWWEGLSSILKVLYCIAVPSTLILLLQTFFAMLGGHDGGAGHDFSDTSGLDLDHSGFDLGHGGLDIDHGGLDIGHGHLDIGHGHDGDIGHGHDIDGGDPSDFTSMRMFTLQTVVAFLTVFGWSGIVLVGAKVPNGLAVGIAAVLGFMTMLLLAKIIQLSKRLQENGTIDFRNAIGEVGTVYIPCPPKNQGFGKVNVTVNGRFFEADAINSTQTLLPTGSRVRVTDLSGDTLIVEPEEE